MEEAVWSSTEWTKLSMKMIDVIGLQGFSSSVESNFKHDTGIWKIIH